MNGPFLESFRDGYLLLLDEINLDSKEVLQCVEESLENRILIIEIPLQEIKAPSILYMN
jgi:midasin (ATPase involved in ribosome maturation)